MSSRKYLLVTQTKPDNATVKSGIIPLKWRFSDLCNRFGGALKVNF